MAVINLPHRFRKSKSSLPAPKGEPPRIHYLIIAAVLALIAAICTCQMGCAPIEQATATGKPLYDGFNDYGRAFQASTVPTHEAAKVRVVMDVWLYGSNADKQRDWAALRQREGFGGGAVQWATVLTDPPVIFGDLRFGPDGLLPNPLILGHELLHVLEALDPRFMDPDLMAEDRKGEKR